MFNLNKRQILTIKQLLNSRESISINVLADILGYNEKTIRNDLKTISKVIENYDADIITKPYVGSTLEINDYDLLQNLLQVFADKYNDVSFIPNYNKDRIDQIIHIILYSDYTKSEDLEDLLFINRTTLYSDIKIVRDILKKYHISLTSKPNYGMHVIGEERFIRVAMSDYMYLDEGNIDDYEPIQFELDYKYVYDLLVKYLTQYNIHMSLRGIEEVINYMIVSEYRIRKGKRSRLEMYQVDEVKGREEYKIVEKMVHEINESADEIEIVDLCIYFVSRITYSINDRFDLKENMSEYFLADEIIKNLLINSNVNFTFNNDLITLLSMLLKNVLWRTKYGIEFRKVPIITTKQMNPCYEYAVLIFDYLNKKYSYSICENEIASLANDIQSLMIDTLNHVKYVKNDVVLVFADGRNSGSYYEKFLKQNYGNYINKFEFREFYELNDLSTDKIIITDISKVKFEISNPIFQIKHKLNRRESKRLLSLFKNKELLLEKFLANFTSDYCIFKCNCKTKEEALKTLTDKMTQDSKITKNLYNSCMIRDQLSSCERGNNVAICHSLFPVSRKSAIGVMVLNSPIVWKEEYVRVIFMVARGFENEIGFENLEYLQYLTMDIQFVYQMIHCEKYEDMLDILKKFFNENDMI